MKGRKSVWESHRCRIFYEGLPYFFTFFDVRMGYKEKKYNVKRGWGHGGDIKIQCKGENWLHTHVTASEEVKRWVMTLL